MFHFERSIYLAKRREHVEWINITPDPLEMLNDENNYTRNAVLIIGTIFDSSLASLIKTKMIDDDKAVDMILGLHKDSNNAPLATFSSRINMSYVLGLITKEEKDALNHFRNLRNAFAHSVTVERNEINKYLLLIFQYLQNVNEFIAQIKYSDVVNEMKINEAFDGIILESYLVSFQNILRSRKDSIE